MFSPPRTLALRKDSGRWVNDPQKVYDEMRAELSKKQVKISGLFNCDNKALLLGGYKTWFAGSRLAVLLLGHVSHEVPHFQAPKTP